MADSPHFERLTVVQLRESCQRRGVETTGLKRELINRLKEHEAENKDSKMDTDEVKEESKDETKEEEIKEDKLDDGTVEEEKEAKTEEKTEEKEIETKCATPTQTTTPKKKSGTSADELLPDGRPKNLGKQKFQYGYMKMLSMKCVVVHPFKPDIFLSDVFKKYFEKAINYTIKDTKWSKTSAVIMEFGDVDEGDEAWAAIHRAIADDQLKVEHPDFHTDSTFWSHRIDTSIDWLLNLGVLKEMEFRDNFNKRCLLFENIPEGTTHYELVQEFPDAKNLIPFGYDPESPSMVGVELFSERKAEEFLEKYQDYEFKGNTLSLEFYNVRFNRFDKILRRYRKEHPEQGFGELSDEERLVKVKDYLSLNDAKKQVNTSYESGGTQKIEKCQELSETQVPIARHLFADAKRRYEKGLAIPEPANEQTAMVKNLVEGKINQRKERAAEGNKIAIEREKKERKRLLQGLKVEGTEKKGKRPAGSGSNLSGYPPHKKLQRGGGAGFTRGRGGMGRGYAAWGMGAMDHPMGLMNSAMGARSGMDRNMGGMDSRMGGMDRRMGGMDRGMGGMDRGMGGMNRKMSGMGGMDRRMGGIDRGLPLEDGFEDMRGGGMNSVSRTVQALTDKVRELEMLTARSGGGGFDSYSSMPRGGSAHSFGHRGHSAGGRRW